MTIKPNQLVTLVNNETGEKRTGRVQSYSPNIITLTIKLNAKNWHIPNYELEDLLKTAKMETFTANGREL